MSDKPYFWIRPYGANETRAQLPADTIGAALQLKRIFGGAIVCAHTGIDYSGYPESLA